MLALADISSQGICGTLAVCLFINWVGFALSLQLKTEDHFDATGLTAAVLASAASYVHACLSDPATASCARPAIATALAVLWAVRLGGFLYYRVTQLGSDSRFDEMKHNATSMFAAWTLQAFWIWLDLMPITIMLRSANSCSGLAALDVLGVAVWLTGFGIEAVADQQKMAFRLNPRNKGKFITSGLWGVVRYPNYAGENLLWWGMVALCAGGMPSGWHMLASCISPLSTAALTLGVSGVPIQEKQAQKRWGDDPIFQEYRARTPMLVPFIRPTKPAAKRD